MSYKILCDSCCDLTPELKAREEIISIPLTINVDDKVVTDDETFNQETFLKMVKESENCPKSSCPAPNDYLKYFKDADEIYIVTLSANLSGSYNSAKVASDMHFDDGHERAVHVFDSCSASVGEMLLVKKITELKESGASFDEVVEKTEKYKKEKKTKFILETLDTLRKNGRLTGIKAVLAEVLNIKPIMEGTVEGKIEKVDQARGIAKGIIRLAEIIANDAYKPEERTLAISHCNNYERAETLKNLVEEKVKFKEVIIVDMGGISSLYANDGGIIAAY